MATIIVKTVPPVINIVEPPSGSLEAGLVALGRILLKDNDLTPWISVGKLRGLFEKHGAKLPRIYLGSCSVAESVRDLAANSGDVRGEGVKVEFKSGERSGPRLPNLCLRFVRLTPDGTPCW
jgi:hypothetical protein